MLKWLFSGLQKKFIATIAILTLTTAIFMAILLVRISQEGIQAAVLELHTKMAEKTAQGVSLYVRSMDDKLRFALGSIQQEGVSWTEVQRMLRSLIESQVEIEEISLLNLGGGEIQGFTKREIANDQRAPGTRITYKNSPGYLKYKRAKSPTIFIQARSGIAPHLEFFYPLSKVSDIRVLVVMESLWEAISQERIGGSGYAMLVGPGGAALIYPKEKLSGEEVKLLGDRQIVRAALSSSSRGSSEYRDSRGVDQVGAYSPVEELGVAVITQQPKNEAYLAAEKMKRAALLITLVVCLAAGLLALLLARTLTKPLLELTRSAEEIAHGGFPREVSIRTGDELQEFSDTFNRMVARLRRYAELQVDRLLLEQKKTEAIMFSIGDGILMTDNEGVIQLVNRKTREFLEKEEGSLVGQPLKSVLPPGSDLKSTILEVVANPTKKAVKEVDMSTDEKRLFLRISAHQLISPAKENVLGVVTAIHDVTLEKELDKMKEEFLHSITHDLRNPLGSIVGFLEFLRKGVTGVLNAQQRNMVESMLRSSNRLMNMVNNILDVAKMETSKVIVYLKEASLAGLSGGALETLASLAKRRGIVLELEAEEEFMINVDPNLIERVITNLVGNAIKFAPDDGKIVVTVIDKLDHMQLCVEDNGVGIPASHIEKIFGKFEQVPGQRRGGTGLGLTISKKFIEAHYGRIWVESELNKGARFYFVIPKGLKSTKDGDVIEPATTVGNR